jgi:hypothetical protein
VVATPQNLNETTATGGPRHRVWQKVVALLAKVEPDDTMTANLLVGLFVRNAGLSERELDRALAAWRQGRQRCREDAA